MTTPEIPGYADLVEVGGGASSVVYRADEPAHARQVAIKVLKSANLRDAERLAFDREVAAMGRLSAHPHIVDLIGSGFTGGRPFIVMPFYHNGTYGSLVSSAGPMGWPELVDFGVKVASALETAHRQGVIHRDVKPANIYRGAYEGQPILADFGVSSFLRAAEGDDLTVGVAGTPLYLAPEVYDGARPNVATDLYALGTTLFGLLEGRAAYANRSIEMVVAAVTSDDPPPTPSTPAPPRFHRLLGSLMAKDPGDRPASALAVVGELNAIQRDAGLLVTPPVIRTVDGTPPTGGDLEGSPNDLDPAEGWPSPSGAGESRSVDRAVGGSVRRPGPDPGGTTEDVDPLDRPTEPNPELVPARPRTVEPMAPPRPGWRLAVLGAVVATAALVAVALLTGDDPLTPGDADTELLTGPGPWSTEPELAGEVLAHDGPVTALGWSADGSTLATGAVDSTLRLWTIAPDAGTASDPRTDPVLRPGDTIEVGGWVLDLAWSADGRRLAAAGTDGMLRVWTVADGSLTGPTVEQALHDGSAEAVAWSPDGRLVATTGSDGSLAVWNLDAADLAWRVEAHDGAVDGLDWSTVEPLLATGGRDGAVRVWRVDDGERVLDLAAHDDWVRAVAWSPRTMALATVASNGQAAVWDARTGDELRRREVGADPVGGMAWVPGADAVVLGTAGGVAEGWDLVADTTAPPIGEAEAEVGAIGWSPAGDLLAVGLGDGRVRLWAIES